MIPVTIVAWGKDPVLLGHYFPRAVYTLNQYLKHVTVSPKLEYMDLRTKR